MKILVTGAAGFIGFHLSLSLLKKKNTVYGIDNLNKFYDLKLKNDRIKILKKFKNFKFNKIDIKFQNKLESFFKKNKINIVIHLAAQAGVRFSLKNPDTYISNNIVGFHNIIKISNKYNIEHFIYASSSSVYGNSKKFPLNENDNTNNPVSLYAATKKSNEVIAQAYSNLYQMRCTGLRFFTVYGPFGRPDMAIYKFTKKINQNKTINLFNNGDHMRDFTYVNDVVTYIQKIISKRSGKLHEIYNISNGKSHSLKMIIKTIEIYFNNKFIKNNKKLQQGDVYKTLGSIKKIKKDFGKIKNTELKAGLRNFFSWFKSYH